MLRRLIFPALLGLLGCAVLISLGVWQVQRLHWKEAILAEIEARIGAPPAAIPAAPDPARDRFLPVAAEGAFLPGEVHVLVAPRGMGPGFRVVAPFRTAEGRLILVDRGFVPEAAKLAPRPTGPARIEGHLHWPDDVDGFTPPPDIGRNIWFARDLPALAAALGTEPVLVVLRTAPQAGGGVTPLPVDTAAIPNDHLEYAITWFGLAAVWAGMTALLIRRTLRRAA